MLSCSCTLHLQVKQTYIKSQLPSIHSAWPLSYLWLQQTFCFWNFLYPDTCDPSFFEMFPIHVLADISCMLVINIPVRASKNTESSYPQNCQHQHYSVMRINFLAKLFLFNTDHQLYFYPRVFWLSEKIIVLKYNYKNVILMFSVTMLLFFLTERERQLCRAFYLELILKCHAFSICNGWMLDCQIV